MKLVRSKTVTMIAGLGTFLAAATGADSPDGDRAPSRAMSAETYRSLSAALNRFDLRLSRAEQESIRDLDARLAGLGPDERSQFLDVMRRYHNWLAMLPDSPRQKVLDAPPSERLAVIQGLTPKYPVPSDDAPYWLRLSEIGGGSPTELAAASKIWNKLTPEERREVDSLPSVFGKRQRLLLFGKSLKIPREIRPPNYNPQEWTPKAEARIEELRLVDGELQAPLTRAEAKGEAARTKGEAAKAVIHAQVLERLALNLFFLSQPPPPPVSPDRLVEFFQSLPPWIQSSFDSYSADEARRRLILVYRLVYPHPEEYHPEAPATGPAGKAAPSRPATSRPAPVQTKPGVVPKSAESPF
ncbi:hypothetical protein [Aquisphaera insulae]|uniref:hypothetical protein n=1 Tax=Aquisphaera insulae TaxID=2712864 RepID=UPI0013EC9B02|nr:hypothetical protein [Aquisphaera insulae]